MKTKKIILGIAAIVLTAVISIGATLAYLTDAEEATNTMTLGKVDIVQYEQERTDYGVNQHSLKTFVQDKPLLPAVYSGDSIPMAPEGEWVFEKDPAWSVVADNSNVVDKFVTVKNDGKSAAYVRTVFAFEKDSKGWIHYVVNNGTNVTSGATWTWEWLNDAVIEIDGVEYTLAVATYTDVLAPMATTIPSLKQVYMDKAADNEYCESFGDKYVIKVFSQAVQSQGFDSIITGPEAALNEAFGEITATNNPWVTTP